MLETISKEIPNDKNKTTSQQNCQTQFLTSRWPNESKKAIRKQTDIGAVCQKSHLRVPATHTHTHPNKRNSRFSTMIRSPSLPQNFTFH